MSLKLYFECSKTGILPQPNQMDESIDVDSIKWKFSSKITPITTGFFLGEIDAATQEVVSILETYDATKYVSQSQLAKMKKENISFLNKETKIKMNIFKKPDDLYMDEVIWNMLVLSFKIEEYPLLIGPKGGGKSSAAYALAQATGRKYYPVNCGSIFKPKQTLVGSMQAKEGTTYLVPSEFMEHYVSEEPVLIFLDELSRLPSGAANYLMTILDRIQSYIYIEEEGRRVYKGSNVRFVAAANFGFEYTDTRNVDGAFLDRFTKFIVDYMPEKEEIELIQNKIPGAHTHTAGVKKLVKIANVCRDQREKLRVGVSTRQLLGMTKYLVAGFSVHEIIDNIFINLFYNGTMDERDNVRLMIQGNI